MTEFEGQSALQDLLAKIARAAGHELRNTLNGLVVNLEAARSLSPPDRAAPFVDHAIAQSEESVRVAESAIALLDLMVAAIGPDSGVSATLLAPDAVCFSTSAAGAERAAIALKGLAERGVISVETKGAAVILTASPLLLSRNTA